MMKPMGSRGASSGIYKKNHQLRKYGSEFTSVYQSGNIKFVKYNDAEEAKTPMETMTNGRVYVTITVDDELKAITYYDKHNKRSKQIDLIGPKHIIDGEETLPHTHKGYYHREKGTFRPSQKEQKIIDRVKKIWNHHIKAGK